MGRFMFLYNTRTEASKAGFEFGVDGQPPGSKATNLRRLFGGAGFLYYVLTLATANLDFAVPC